MTVSASSSGARKSAQDAHRLLPPRIVMVGPPGSGKSSQARELASRLGVRHLSSGDMLRSEVHRASPVGVRANAYMRAGDLVPDWLVDLLYEEQLADALDTGFVLDGYPRTESQARHLLDVLADRPPTLLVQLVVPDDVVMVRLGGRCTCVRCGMIESCDEGSACSSCGAMLRRRVDDHDDVIRARLACYHDLIEPLLEALRDVALRAVIDANRSPEAVACDLFGLLAGPGLGAPTREVYR